MKSRRATQVTVYVREPLEYHVTHEPHVAAAALDALTTPGHLLQVPDLRGVREAQR